MMVKAAPAAAFVVAKPEFLLEVLIIALDPPAPLGLPDEFCEGGVGRQGGEPVFGRFGLALRPLDQAPFLGPWLATLGVAMGGTDPHGSEAGCQAGIAPFAPGNAPKGLCRQSDGKILGRDRLVGVVVAQPCGAAAAPAPGLRGPGRRAGRPQRGRRLAAA